MTEYGPSSINVKIVLFFYFYNNKNVEKETAITALGSLAQETRLDIFRYLVGMGSGGAAAGTIANHLGVPAATLSFHLKTLQQAGFILRRRQSQSLIYRVNFDAIGALMSYLINDCCGGHPDLCQSGLGTQQPVKKSVTPG